MAEVIGYLMDERLIVVMSKQEFDEMLAGRLLSMGFSHDDIAEYHASIALLDLDTATALVLKRQACYILRMDTDDLEYLGLTAGGKFGSRQEFLRRVVSGKVRLESFRLIGKVRSLQIREAARKALEKEVSDG